MVRDHEWCCFLQIQTCQFPPFCCPLLNGYKHYIVESDSSRHYIISTALILILFMLLWIAAIKPQFYLWTHFTTFSALTVFCTWRLYLCTEKQSLLGLDTSYLVQVRSLLTVVNTLLHVCFSFHIHTKCFLNAWRNSFKICFKLSLQYLYIQSLKFCLSPAHNEIEVSFFYVKK